MLPQSGSVLGLDVGWSLTSKSSGICRLDWDATTVTWTLRHFTGHEQARREAIAAVAGAHQLLAAALDGPLRGDLAVIDKFRQAERLLSQKAIAQRISQPGSSGSPVGRALNHHTNAFVKLLLERGSIAEANHAHAIHGLALVEAFPTGFLGLLHQAPEKGLRLKRSDRYYEALVADGTLGRLVAHHLPGRELAGDLAGITNHDERAALVCALTALGIANNDYVAVGDTDGWIILPPPLFIADWAKPLLAGWN